jgi:hypothetical protein
MKHVSLKQLVFLIVISLNQCVVAKVAVPPPVSDGTRVFHGYKNYVEAVDPASGQVLWRTVLYKRWKPIIINPFVEEDVQWNIVTSLNLDGKVLVVVNKKGSKYFLDTKTGEQVRNPIHKEQWTTVVALVVLAVAGLFCALWIIPRRKRRVESGLSSINGNHTWPAR